MIGITENERALKRWMVAGPLVGHMIDEYEKTHSGRSKHDIKHYEQTTSVQREFSLGVKRVVDVMSQLDNPFIDESNQLLTHKL